MESYAGFNSLKPFISKLLMCDLDCFSKIQSHIKLSDNRDPCFSRLKLLHKRLLKNPGILHEYDCIIQDQLERSIIERVPMQQTNKEKGSIH